jgi:hypothetical protein
MVISFNIIESKTYWVTTLSTKLKQSYDELETQCILLFKNQSYFDFSGLIFIIFYKHRSYIWWLNKDREKMSKRQKSVTIRSLIT